MGVVNGLIMGFLVMKLKIHAFIASIGMQLVLKGAMYIYSGGKELSIGRDYDLNEALNGQLLPFLPLSTYFIITTIFVVVVMIILTKTRLGRNIHMVGGNAETAWLAGVKSDRAVIAAFVISGLAAGLGGALNGIYSGAANITMGEKGISLLHGFHGHGYRRNGYLRRQGKRRLDIHRSYYDRVPEIPVQVYRASGAGDRCCTDPVPDI